jgi:uncharacterized membrane protein YphA (DoxX/SURF4 family)
LTAGSGPSAADADLAAIVLATRLLLGSLFMLAGVAKLRDRTGFQRAVDRYQLLPASLVGPFAAVLPWTEVAVGAALVVGVAIPLAAGVATVLLVGFAVAVAVNLGRGQDIDCGCAGAAGGTRISWWLVARNTALAVVAASVAVVTTGRTPVPLAPLPAGDVVAVALTVVAVLGTTRLLAHAAAVRAALAAAALPDQPLSDRSPASGGEAAR